MLQIRHGSHKKYNFRFKKKSAWCPKSLLSKTIDLHSTKAFDSLTQFSPSFLYAIKDMHFEITV